MESHPRRRAALDWLLAAATENVGLKGTSLLIALALFGMVRGAGNVQRSIEVSLLARLPSASARRVLRTDLPDKVRVTLRGPPSLVASVRADELGPIQIDLSDGRRPLARLDPGLFQVPAGVEVEQVQPSSLQLEWDALVQRDVPVRAQLAGQPQAGSRLVGTPEVSPPTLHVSGPALDVEALAAIRTTVIDLTALAPGRYERRVAIEEPNRHVAFELAGGVRVTFAIDRDIVERRFDRLTVTPVGPAPVTVRPPFVSVVVRGAPARVAGLDAAELVPTVAVGDGGLLGAGARLGVDLSRLPEGVGLIAIEPAEVIVAPTR